MPQEAAEQQPEVSEAEQHAQALAAARAALSSSLDAPAAAHPYESYGTGGLSLAQARRKLSGYVRPSIHVCAQIGKVYGLEFLLGRCKSVCDDGQHPWKRQAG